MGGFAIKTVRPLDKERLEATFLVYEDQSLERSILEIKFVFTNQIKYLKIVEVHDTDLTVPESRR